MRSSKRGSAPLELHFVELCAGNDTQGALTVLWEYRPRLILSLRRKYSSYIPYEDCEDIVTDALVEACKEGRTFDPTKASLPTWLNTRVHYQALQFLRKHNCEFSPINIIAELAAPDLLLAEQAAREMPSEHMRLALDQLYPAWARAIRLFYYEGLSIALIATQMQIAQSTVRCYIARGIGRLSQIMTMAEAETESDE
jgi:RNA polymerase sigma factor (sigma-70 family)